MSSEQKLSSYIPRSGRECRAYPFPERSRMYNRFKLLSNKFYAARRRARESGASDTLTLIEFFQLIEDSNGICAYCHKWVGIEGLGPDHVIPLSLGGANSRDNLAAACSPCNYNKGYKTNWLPQSMKKTNSHISYE
jgi:5-methylcytosine-specific restriction endonuclease McrA